MSLSARLVISKMRVCKDDKSALSRLFTALLAAIAPTNSALSGSATHDPASLADGAGVTTTVTVTGAAVGDFAMAAASVPLQGVLVTAWVSAADTVSVRYQNETTGAVDLASHTLRAVVLPFGSFANVSNLAA